MPALPVFFRPVVFPRIWGGRDLEKRFHRPLPDDGQAYGESWEISDRPELSSEVISGEFSGVTLHDLWTGKREELFGRGYERFDRFPLLCKILDAKDKLSIQVHPPASAAPALGGEPKTEIWYIAEAAPGAILYSGWKQETTREEVEQAVRSGSLESLIHTICPARGESLFIPSGRIHAIGAGLQIFEIQENSDTTYRLYDWNRTDDQGRPRELHVSQSLQSIHLDDIRPQARPAEPGTLADTPEFRLEEILLKKGDLLTQQDPEHFALAVVAEGTLDFGEGVIAQSGDFFLLPQQAAGGVSRAGDSKVLYCTVPVRD